MHYKLHNSYIYIYIYTSTHPYIIEKLLIYLYHSLQNNFWKNIPLITSILWKIFHCSQKQQRNRIHLLKIFIYVNIIILNAQSYNFILHKKKKGKRGREKYKEGRNVIIYRYNVEEMIQFPGRQPIKTLCPD